MFPVTVAKPRNIRELWKKVSALPKPRKYLAGGTDLCVWAGHNPDSACNWIDISSLPELCRIKETKTALLIGAGVKIADLAENPAVRKWAPALADACSKFASPTLRNMATLGGNCANASPSADGACALCAEGASALVANKGKTRKIPVEKLFAGPKKTCLKQDDLITAFEIAKTPRKGVFMKLAAREKFAISKVSAAIVLRNGAEARIFLGAVGPTVLRAAGAEAALAAGSSAAQAGQAAENDASPIDDIRSVAAYRREMAGVLVGRGLKLLGARC